VIRTRAALTAIAEAAALLGGLLLLAAVAVTCASVGRGMFGRPILGDSEVVEMCLGIAVALFLPWCEMQGAQVIVDFFTAKLPGRAIRGLDAAMRAVAAAVIAVLAWRLAEGGYAMWDRERETMFLQIPFWWGYAGAAMGMVLWTVTAGFVAVEQIRGTPRHAEPGL
jgi:TRAP-type C4-dicarboxylate transport system permease small subunit